MEASARLQKYPAVKSSALADMIKNTPWLISLGLLAIGLFFFYFRSFRAGFSLLPGDSADGRLCHYFLEHSWLWISGDTLHAEFWNAPFFYPVKNVMAYSETLLGAAPIYWFFRALGVPATLSYLIFPGILGILNYCAMYIFLRHAFKTDPVPSGGGAFLFSFCAPRLVSLIHIQMYPQFYTPIFMLMLFLFGGNFRSDLRKSHFALLCASLCAALQFYAGFYLGWFLMLGFCLFIIVAFVFSPSRNLLFTLLKTQWPWLLLALVFFIALVFPMLLPYMEEQARAGRWAWNEVTLFLPMVKTFFNTSSFLYKNNFALSYEHLMGIGFISFGISLYGLIWGARKNIWCKIFFIMFIGIFLLSTLQVSDTYLWKILYEFFPGAGAIRAVTRIFFLLLAIMSIGYAFSMQNKRAWIQVVFLCILLVENMTFGFMYNKTSRYEKESGRIAALAKEKDMPFAYISDQKVPILITNLDAMWASVFSGRPTINGYSGRFPSPEYFSFPETPQGAIYGSDFLRAVAKPYLLIRNHRGSLEAQEIRDERDLADESAIDWSKPCTLDFSQPHLPIKISGLSVTESWGRWSNAKEVKFTFPNPLPAAFDLQFEASAFGPNGNRDVELVIGNAKYTFTLGHLPEQRVLKIENPQHARSFTITVPEPVSPLQLGVNEDSRELGLGFRRLTITPLRPDAGARGEATLPSP